MKKLLLVLGLVFLFSIPCFAQGTITFEWDPHPEASQLTGFKLYATKQCGTYGTSPYVTWTGGSLTTGTASSPGLGNWCFVLTAYVPNLESDYSNEVSLTIKPKPPKVNSVVQTALNGVKKIAEWAGLIEHKNLRVK